MLSTAAHHRPFRLLLPLGLALPLLIAVVGFIEQWQKVPVNWIVLTTNFLVFTLLIDLPLVALGFWLGLRIDATTERVMVETLDRSLRISARLFYEQWQQDHAQDAAQPEHEETLH